jgi:quinol monooxygenase YgiN
VVAYTLEIVVQEEKREEIESILRSITGPVGVMEGCLECRVSQDLEERTLLLLREKWATEDLLKKRLRGDDFRKVLAVMDLATEPPRIRFNLTSGERGLEYLTAARAVNSKHVD